ncbi:MAG: rare lipoprotein A [Parcubacteria group bacterium Gr01-1014_106]|nr:MAG: rare lipoprotein A [Parcubacteria group bacterium Gr01-1014_106]
MHILLRRMVLLLAVCAIAMSAHTASAEGEDDTPPPPKASTAAKKPSSKEQGLASWYRSKRALVAAHRTLPVGTKVKVTTPKGTSVVVTIAGRGPFIPGRVIDLSSDAFKRLATLGTGVLRVTIQRL